MRRLEWGRIWYSTIAFILKVDLLNLFDLSFFSIFTVNGKVVNEKGKAQWYLLYERRRDG